MREHAIAGDGAGRTLFVANLPPRCTREWIEGVFGPCGRIVSVESSSHTLPGDCATIVFSDADGLAAALHLDGAVHDGAVEGSGLDRANGIEHFLADARARLALAADPERLRSEADAVVRSFVKARQRRSAKNEAAATTADDEGWTLVAARRGARKKKSIGAGGVRVSAARPMAAGKVAIKQKTDLKRREKILKGFYQFNKETARQKDLEMLRRRFQLDRQRVQKMKQGRKFTP